MRPLALCRSRQALALGVAVALGAVGGGCGSASSGSSGSATGGAGSATGGANTGPGSPTSTGSTTHPTTTSPSRPGRPSHPSGGSRKNTFRGRVIRASGHFAGTRGTYSIVLHVAPGGAQRLMTAVIRGRICRPDCVRLRVSLRGSFTFRRRVVPDAGNLFTVHGTGRTASLGPFTVTGTGHGTGFIARGREQLRLTLTARDGTVTITAQSPRVGGFSSP